MNNVFIGNPTLQHREFHYRVPGKETPRMLVIPAGHQEVLPGDFEGTTLASIIAQIERAGGIPKNDLDAIKRPHTMLYEVAAKPISADHMNEAMALDTEARQEVAGEQMERAGLQAFNIAQKAGVVQETSVTIEEVTDVKTVTDGVNFEVTVSAKPGKAGRMKRSTKRQ